jgi:hypothetical protein
MTFFINETHLGPGATKRDALDAIWDLEGLGWEVQYGDGPTWKEVLASDPEELAAFEEDLKKYMKR